ncbi:MAG: hypothetical protein EOO58_03240 [Hymenobacter sp.]|nr:MAG: hypothetical protein EOO58_03240 [Hymenobacter sp.]
MKKKVFDFNVLGEALRADTQAFLDSYAAKYPADGPILAFCLYFDVAMDATGMLLPQRAANQAVGAAIDDVASWYRYADHVQGELSEPTQTLFEAYQELMEDEDADEDEIIAQFTQMIRTVIHQLSFDKVPKTDDFIYFADGMDDEYEQWKETIPPALLKKHFGI